MSRPKITAADERRGELRKRRISNLSIARATGTTQEMVSYVLRGHRLHYEGADRVMAYVAGLLRMPVDDCFPEAKERTSR